MYYVIYTGAGKENKTEDYIKRMIPGYLYDACFHPGRKRNIKLGGVWHMCCDNLIPGYIFLKTGNIEDFYIEIKKNPAHLRILGKNAEGAGVSFYPLSEPEVEWLMKLTDFVPRTEPAKPVSSGEFSVQDTMQTEETKTEADFIRDGKVPVAEISEVGFDENDKVVILSGPLKNLEGCIKKINLHKRIAEVEIDFMQRKTVVYMGIEILGSKNERPNK
ncbi:MAG: hypothetical protein K6G24_05775 [Lachnospiraceae bacterium]|nr:hypothetical protein [Lachnospiraceae bacterium]